MRHIGWIIFASYALLSAPASARISVDEVRGGVLAQGCCGNGSNKEEGVSLNLEALFDSPRFLRVLAAPRPLIGVAVATDGRRNQPSLRRA